VEVLNVRVHRVFEGDLPVGTPVNALVEEDVYFRVEVLLGNVLLKGGGFTFAHPYPDDSFEHNGGVMPCLRTRLPADERLRPLTEYCNVLPLAVENPTVIWAGNGAREVAITLGKPGASVRAHISQGGDLTLFLTPEDAKVFPKHLYAKRLLSNATSATQGVPVLPESQLGDEMANVTAQLRHTSPVRDVAIGNLTRFLLDARNTRCLSHSCPLAS
jgi:hypothetical protein